MTACWQKDVGRSFYPSGKVRTEATVRNGLLDGPSTMLYESGAKLSEANYRAGLLHGKSTVMDVVGFRGEIVFDASKPDGTPRKLLNVNRMGELGWKAQTSLREGIAKAYADFLANSFV